MTVNKIQHDTGGDDDDGGGNGVLFLLGHTQSTHNPQYPSAILNSAAGNFFGGNPANSFPTQGVNLTDILGK